MTENLLEIDELYKKFSTNLRRGMIHGLGDWMRAMTGRGVGDTTLREGEFFGIQNVSFNLRNNEILAITGVNGSGKTTLMRLISGIYLPDAGEIRRAEDLRITAIFALNAGMQQLFTGRENIYLKCAIFGMSRAEIEAALPFIEEFSELGDRLDRPYGNYSSGMRSRLSYSIAMATRPDVFIIDESLAVGDSAFKAKCYENLREFAAQPGKGVLFVTNQLRKVSRLADRLIVMEAGQIIKNTEDVTAGMEFYIANCYRHVDPERREAKLRKVREFEF